MNQYWRCVGLVAVTVFFGVNLYDYGARFYDAALGRWNVMDPMSDAYCSYSSYTYVLNNPISVIDVNGKWSLSNHHKMTMEALSNVGIGGRHSISL